MGVLLLLGLLRRLGGNNKRDCQQDYDRELRREYRRQCKRQRRWNRRHPHCHAPGVVTAVPVVTLQPTPMAMQQPPLVDQTNSSQKVAEPNTAATGV
ncbi:hypothetical protein PHYSODRAFT_261614 [Phytophthora sojae]|uniref:Uncharacterized protein n=1 Tax=Phytophthora sojae (strain P6497) TaxID=1094619 RepID=G4YH16_PHYSP|nr:hypothetical protein PHYSODRAFT_261614 [Phytophthora sojae]EGZ27717.1 hypothetical protein PHYSODRAFT_261614 [Phytophthora sojae]|eukprot:XP_009514992.1 hypothetical protein PHYSODRAFT_261614 [Phytophthora sojae]